jgi:hypothetical protein
MKRIASAMVILVAGIAQAIEEPGWPGLKQRLLEHASLQVARENAREAQTIGAHAGRRPLPVMELEVENFGGTKDAAGFSRTTAGFWMGSEFRLGDVSGAERALAAEEARRAGRDTLLARRELLWSARMLWENWLQERWTTSLLDSNVLDLRSWESALDDARTAGRAEPWEVSQVRADRMALEARSRAARERSIAHWTDLVRLGGEAAEPAEVGSPAPLAAIGSGDGFSSDSLVRIGEAEMARAEALIQAAQARPSVDAAIGVLTDAATGSVGLGARLAVPLPPWNRIGLEGARARTRAQVAQRSAEIAGMQRRLSRQSLARVIESERRAWLGLVDTVVPARLTAAASALVAYRRGAIPPETVGRLREGVWQARIEAMERLETLRKLQLELRNLEGVEP